MTRVDEQTRYGTRLAITGIISLPLGNTIQAPADGTMVIVIQPTSTTLLPAIEINGIQTNLSSAGFMTPGTEYTITRIVRRDQFVTVINATVLEALFVDKVLPPSPPPTMTPAQPPNTQIELIIKELSILSGANYTGFNLLAQAAATLQQSKASLPNGEYTWRWIWLFLDVPSTTATVTMARVYVAPNRAFSFDTPLWSYTPPTTGTHSILIDFANQVIYDNNVATTLTSGSLKIPTNYFDNGMTYDAISLSGYTTSVAQPELMASVIRLASSMQMLDLTGYKNPPTLLT